MGQTLDFDLCGRRVWIAGHKGLLGSALVRRLATEDCEIIVVDRSEIDLRRQDAVRNWVGDQKPDVVFLAAATVGGILANTERPAEFLYNNLMIVTNVIEAARQTNVAKLIFVASSAIYPLASPQPISENALMTGPLEAAHESYGLAKIAGIKLCQAMRKQHGADFISAAPTNLFGPGDNFDLTSGHVLPSLIRRVHEAKVRGDRQLTVWGTGSPLREFLHVDDCADALVFLAKHYSDAPQINVGSGSDIAVRDLVRLICTIVGFEREIVHDLTKPDGAPKRLINSSRLRTLGWNPTLSLEEGIRHTYAWFTENISNARLSNERY